MKIAPMVVIGGLAALLTTIAFACDDPEQAPTPTTVPTDIATTAPTVMPTPDPTPAPTDIPTPTNSPTPTPTRTPAPTDTPEPVVAVAPTPEITPTAEAKPVPTATPSQSSSPQTGLNFNETTLGRDVIGALTEDEESCIREELGEEAFEEFLKLPALVGDPKLDMLPINCLAEETAIELSIELVAWVAGELSADSRECLGQVYADSGAIALGYGLSSELPDSGEADSLRFAVPFLLCLTDKELEMLVPRGMIPSPSAFRCVFEHIGIEEYINMAEGLVDAMRGEPSPEFLKAQEALQSANEACGIEGVSREPPLAGERLLWRFRASKYVHSTPVVVDGVAYVGAGDGRLYAVDIDTGDLLWRVRVTVGGTFPLTVADGVVYGGSSLKALDADSGDVLWEYDSGRIDYSAPVVSGGVVYVGSLDRSLHAVDAETGSARWRYRTDGESRSAPIVVDRVVFFSSNDDHMYAVDAATGDLLWRYQAEGSVYSPTISDGILYFGTRDHLYAVDAATGSLVWRIEGGTETAPAVMDDVVYFTSGHSVSGVHTGTGRLRFKYLAAGPVYSTPAVADGIVYFGSSDRHLYAVDAATGRGMWRYRTGGQIRSTPAVADGVVYFGSADDHLYALSTAANIPSQAPTPPPTPVPGLAKLTPGPPSDLQDILRVFGVAVAISRDGATIAVGDSKKATDRKYDGVVYVFTRTGEDWPDLGEDAAAKLLPPDDNDWDPVPDDRDWIEYTSSFGRSVAMSADGSTVVVGAPDNLPYGYDSGAAYVFTRPAGGWGGTPEVATLTASDGRPNHRFGHAVGISADGQTIAIGASGTYVFAKPSGGWEDAIETAKLTVSDGSEYGEIGSSVAVSVEGTTIIVGASSDTHEGVRSGAAYVFTRPSSEWADATETARLTPSDGTDDDYFGYVVAVSEDAGTVVVGAPGKDAYGDDHGAAYVFVRTETRWANAVETAKMRASDGGREDRFGRSLAVSASGDTIIAGAPGHAHALDRSGAAYVFIRPGEGWRDATETSELKNPSNPARGSFGMAMSASGDSLVVGAPSNGVYVFNSY